MQGLLSRTRLETVAGHGNDRGPGPAEYLVEDSVDAAHCQSATSCEQRPNTTTWRDDVAWVHWAPPCGTFSRAREIPRPDAPKPLRSVHRPAGLKGLSGTDALRVRSANSLLAFMASCCESLAQRHLCWCIENPARSLLWVAKELKKIGMEGFKHAEGHLHMQERRSRGE